LTVFSCVSLGFQETSVESKLVIVTNLPPQEIDFWHIVRFSWLISLIAMTLRYLVLVAKRHLAALQWQIRDLHSSDCKMRRDFALLLVHRGGKAARMVRRPVHCSWLQCAAKEGKDLQKQMTKESVWF